MPESRQISKLSDFQSGGIVVIRYTIFNIVAFKKAHQMSQKILGDLPKLIDLLTLEIIRIRLLILNTSTKYFN